MTSLEIQMELISLAMQMQAVGTWLSECQDELPEPVLAFVTLVLMQTARYAENIQDALYQARPGLPMVGSVCMFY
jgi:hypothetical protein